MMARNMFGSQFLLFITSAPIRTTTEKATHFNPSWPSPSWFHLYCRPSTTRRSHSHKCLGTPQPPPRVNGCSSTFFGFTWRPLCVQGFSKGFRSISIWSCTSSFHLALALLPIFSLPFFSLDANKKEGTEPQIPRLATSLAVPLRARPHLRPRAPKGTEWRRKTLCSASRSCRSWPKAALRLLRPQAMLAWGQRPRGKKEHSRGLREDPV